MQTTRAKPKRPLILSLLAGLLFLRAALIAVLFVLLFVFRFSYDSDLAPLLEAELALLELALGAVIVLLFIAAYGLWMLRPWAWSLNMVLLGFMLIAGLWSYFGGSDGLTNQLIMLLNIVIVFYLVQKDVRALFIPGTGGVT